MENKPHKYRAVLEESNVEGRCLSILEAYVRDDWTLMLEGYDIGPLVEEHWGDSDYEYWTWVEPGNVPKVLIELIKDRFKNASAFKAWLDEKGIEYKSHSFA